MGGVSHVNRDFYGCVDKHVHVERQKFAYIVVISKNQQHI